MNEYKRILIPRDWEEPKGFKKILQNIDLWWYEKIKHTWYYRNIINPWENFKVGIKNIIKWLPIVWKDRDWGDWYIYEILKFKIKNTRDLILNNNICIDEDLER